MNNLYVPSFCWCFWFTIGFVNNFAMTAQSFYMSANNFSFGPANYVKVSNAHAD